MDFTEGRIARKLIVFSLPVTLGVLLQTAYNIVDTFFIGMIGPDSLAAVSVSFPVIFAFIALANGLGIGVNSLVSRAIGRKRPEAANNVADNAVLLAIVLSLSISLVCIWASPFLFPLMGATGNVLSLALEYSTPIFLSAVFTFAWSVSSSIMRAEGNSKTPMKNLAFSVVLNAVLDPFLIFGIGPFPRLGLFGAAMSTFFSDFVAAALNFSYLLRKKSVVTVSLKRLKLSFACMKEILKIGVPSSASQLLTSAGFVMLVGLVGAFGSNALAAFGIGMRVNSVIILPIIGISSSVVSFVGQNIGAGKYDRARKGSVAGVLLTLCFAAVAVSITMLFPALIISFFTQDQSVIAIGAAYLSIVPLAYLLYSLYFSLSAAFEGAGRTHLSLATNVTYWIVAIGLAAFLSPILGLHGIWIAIVSAAAAEALAVLALFHSKTWEKAGGK